MIWKFWKKHKFSGRSARCENLSEPFRTCCDNCDAFYDTSTKTCDEFRAQQIMQKVLA